MDKSSGLSRSFVWVLSSSSLSGPCGTSYISCSGAGNVLTSVLLVRQMWFPKYLQCAILSKLRLSLESLWFAFKNCLQGFIIPITWIFIIYLQIYLDECCVQLCLFRKLSLLCTWMSKKKSCKSIYTPTTEEQNWLPSVEFQFLILRFVREIIISLSGLVSSFNVCEKKTTLEILKLKLPIPKCWNVHLLNHSGFLNLQANKIYWQNCPCSPICVIELQVYSCLSFGNNYTHTHRDTHTHTHTHNYIASLFLKINHDFFIKPQCLENF